MNTKRAASFSIGLISLAGGVATVTFTHYAQSWIFGYVVALFFSLFGALTVDLMIGE